MSSFKRILVSLPWFSSKKYLVFIHAKPLCHENAVQTATRILEQVYSGL
jgi:hypothetical protein